MTHRKGTTHIHSFSLWQSLGSAEVQPANYHVVCVHVCACVQKYPFLNFWGLCLCLCIVINYISLYLHLCFLTFHSICIKSSVCVCVCVCMVVDIRCRWFPVASLWEATSWFISGCTSLPLLSYSVLWQWWLTPFCLQMHNSENERPTIKNTTNLWLNLIKKKQTPKQ